MNTDRLRPIILTSYIIAISSNFCLESIPNFIQGNETVIGVVKTFSTSSIVVAWLSFYLKIGWKFKILRLILPRFDLNGTWFGKYESVDKSNQEYVGEIAIRIKQECLRISLISSTEKYRNFSYSAELKHDDASDSHGVVYAYSQKENNILDIGHRNGACELTLVKIAGEHWLEGNFWTMHGTQGKICVKRIIKKPIDTFQETKSLAGIES